ncbi:hypothetical protein PBT90_04130 [Algoriphagus halophytocola]|uniref:Uncharacterized protein n=1 Tax=Algoriphagus halophytocola TaxID=2991499 RepID=A0ABY6MFP3_9BACT|nr:MULTISPECIES: hypothetical protein [unclassified Algoriphagus]UZD22607.1 hypothetical protein OM944_18390 [Algoriphagus sp. TR-M5]WBL43873.1 hypothetical protein PBT90_04130 [Algoriphagus sp. TR-M9]
MDIRNDASNQYFSAQQTRSPKTPSGAGQAEVASNLKFNISYAAFAYLLAEKRIYIFSNLSNFNFSIYHPNDYLCSLLA